MTLTPKQAKRARKKANKEKGLVGSYPPDAPEGTVWRLPKLENRGRMTGPGTKRRMARTKKLFGRDWKRLFNQEGRLKPFDERHPS